MGHYFFDIQYACWIDLSVCLAVVCQRARVYIPARNINVPPLILNWLLVLYNGSGLNSPLKILQTEKNCEFTCKIFADLI